MFYSDDEERDYKNDRPWEKVELSNKERFTVILGALKAGALIWLCYAVVFGGFIWLLTRI